MRFCLCLLAIAVGSLAAADLHSSQTLRGKLRIHRGQPSAIETGDHKMIQLDGDENAQKVPGDERLNGFDVEAKGHFTAPDRFLLDGSHTHSLMVRQNGRLKLITYWCDVCSIRAYAPGPCVCCQKETALDLRDPDDK
jgi:hypothetical protein